MYYHSQACQHHKLPSKKALSINNHHSTIHYHLCSHWIFAGYLTTRGTLLSIIHILAKRPDLQKSLHTEIDNMVGVDRKPNLTDRQHCPFVDAVIIETLRFISHLPTLFHNTTEGTNIAGIPVDQNTTVCHFYFHICTNMQYIPLHITLKVNDVL